MRKTLEEIYSIFLKNSNISTDSRQILPGCLFFALKGENFDGNKYAQKALDEGAAYSIIDDEAFDSPASILVDDVLVTLQNLANMHRRKFNIPVLAITGSNGKTTTKELVNAVLSQKYKVTATKGNLNNHIGVPLTLLGVTDETQLAIIEMGANHQKEIEQLCNIAEPTHGMITNIGKAHLGGFGGYEGVIKAKSELYAWLRASGGKAFVNAENRLLMELTTGIERILYGSKENVFARGTTRENTDMLTINWISETGTIDIKTNLTGNYNFENAMAAICTGMFFNVPIAEIKTAICNYVPSNSRSQLMKTAKNDLILDAYNANPTSMQAAIENLRQMKAIHKMVILGDMLELGDESLTEHSSIVKLINESNFDRAILVGPDFKEAARDIFTCFQTSEEAREYLKTQNITGYTILVKGSRGIKMENVLEAL